MRIYARTIVDFLDNSAKLYPDKTALFFEKTEYTYSQVKDYSERVAGFLSRRIKKRDFIGLLMSNRPEFIISYFAIFKAGGIVLLLDQGISDDNFQKRIIETKTHIVLSETKFKEKLSRAKLLKKVDFIDIEKQEFEVSKFKKAALKPSDISTIIYTSGATSEPKAARLRHYNVVAATKNIINYLEIRKDDIDVNISSLSHSFGLGHVHTMFASGGSIILFKNSINLKGILKTIVEKKATTFAATPAILRLITNHLRTEIKECGNYLRLIQTNISPLEPDLVRDILGLLPKTKFCYYYGLSEASRAKFLTFNNNLKKIKSVGKSSPSVEIKIVDPFDKKLDVGKSGEICIKGTIVIKDYLNNTKASKRIKNGWFHTGDYGYLDKDGFLFFQGRRDDIINISGEKVFPEEVEEYIRGVPGILDAAVVGVPDKLLGETITAFIKVKNKRFDKDLIIQACREKLESYKVPKSIQIIQEIPRTNNGKLRRNVLRSGYELQ